MTGSAGTAGAGTEGVVEEVWLRSGQVAAAAGVHVETLRYYERRGLLAVPDRSPGGHRRYPPETVTVVRAIKAAQRLGFTLDEATDLLAANGRERRRRPPRHRRPSGAGLHQRARDKLVEVEARIADLHAVRTTLVAALDAGCDDLLACARTDSCPVPFVASVPAAGGDLPG